MHILSAEDFQLDLCRTAGSLAAEKRDLPSFLEAGPLFFFFLFSRGLFRRNLFWLAILFLTD